ncbi:MAG: 2-isopropylmalate synthase [Acidobacteriota bacterium]
MTLRESDLIYDWNRLGQGDLEPARPRLELDDETLRDGLQSPSVLTPTIDEKLEILHYIAELGIEGANIGLPGAGPHVVRDVTRLAREIVDQKLPISPNCAARTLRADLEPIVEVSQSTGIAIEVACFIGSSPIRQYAETWKIDRMLKLTQEAVEYATGEGLPVMFVTEDTTRAHPDDLRRLYTVAIEAGARRLCIADTVGHATPSGTGHLVRFIRDLADRSGEQVKVDWHGHKDRGLSVINALTAAAAGADRLHGTAIGIGERVGNTPIDQLLVNMQLLGWIDRDLSKLPAYCRRVSEATGVPLPDNYPIFGKDAFRTGTGVHAAAIIKARAKGDDWLADRIYSGVPAAMIGRRQRIEIGPMCGESNIVYWLEERGIAAESELVGQILRAAKEATRVLEEQELLDICRSCGAQVG